MEFFSKIINGLVATSLIPFIALNFLGGLVGGVWLLFMGEWRLVGSGILLLIFASFLHSIVLIPTLPLTALFAYLLGKGQKVLAGITAFVSMLYVQAVGLIWTIAIFLVMVSYGQDTHLLPYLLFGYSLATGPYSYMASKEGGDATASHMAVWLVQFAYVLFFLFYYLNILPYALPIILIVTLLVELWLLKLAFMIHELETQHESVL